MIDPSTIDLNLLPWLPLEERTAFPKRPAIYFAIDSLGAVQYIGRSQNVRTRWCRHHKYSALNAIGNVKIAYLFVDTPELLPANEQLLIQFFNPPLNSVLRNQTVQELRAKEFFKRWTTAKSAELPNFTQNGTAHLYY